VKSNRLNQIYTKSIKKLTKINSPKIILIMRSLSQKIVFHNYLKKIIFGIMRKWNTTFKDKMRILKTLPLLIRLKIVITRYIKLEKKKKFKKPKFIKLIATYLLQDKKVGLKLKFLFYQSTKFKSSPQRYSIQAQLVNLLDHKKNLQKYNLKYQILK